ncbi:MAG: SDR family NAD(P)-dependent oxidoreductase [Myxococcota bacterium]
MSEQRGAGAAFDVAGRAAVVTGAARGIGRGIALELARAGADWVLGDAERDRRDADAGRDRRRVHAVTGVACGPEVL